MQSSQVELLHALARAREFKSIDRFLSADPVRKEPARCGYCRASLNTEKGSILQRFFCKRGRIARLCRLFHFFLCRLSFRSLKSNENIFSFGQHVLQNYYWLRKGLFRITLQK